MYLYFPVMLTSPQRQGRRTGNEAGRECSLPIGGDVKQGWEGLQEPPGISWSLLWDHMTSCLCLFWVSASSLSFYRLPFPALGAQGKRWLRLGALRRMTKVSEFPGEIWWPPWVRVQWMFLRRSQRRKIMGWSLTSEVSVSWVWYSRVHTVLSPKYQWV